MRKRALCAPYGAQQRDFGKKGGLEETERLEPQQEFVLYWVESQMSTVFRDLRFERDWARYTNLPVDALRVKWS